MSTRPAAGVARTQQDMTHDLWLPDEVISIREQARCAAEQHIAPVARDIDATQEAATSFPWKPFQSLADEGMFGIPFSTPHGLGLTHPNLATCTATEEIAYHSSSMAGVYDGQCILVPQALSFANEELRSTLIPGLTSGSMVFSFATTEPHASSDLSPEAMCTTAEETADGFLVNGRKRWITNSVVADWVTVLCRTGSHATMLAIDLKNSPGVRIGEPDQKMGHHGQLTADIMFDNVHVPPENALGEVGRGLPVALSCLTRGRIGIGAAGVGVAQAALDLAVNRLRTREVFGQPLGAMQHWQFTMARHTTEIECARSLYQKAALILDQGKASPEPEAAMAKARGSKLAVDVTRDAVQVHGALGFARQVSETGESMRLEELYRDSKILEIFEGANELQQWVIARQLLGRDVTG